MDGGEYDSQNGWTALMWAAQNGHADCVRLLLDAGADKDAKTRVRVGRFRQIVIATQTVTTLAGSGASGSANGIGVAAQFVNPHGLAVD